MAGLGGPGRSSVLAPLALHLVPDLVDVEQQVVLVLPDGVLKGVVQRLEVLLELLEVDQLVIFTLGHPVV